MKIVGTVGPEPSQTICERSDRIACVRNTDGINGRVISL